MLKAILRTLGPNEIVQLPINSTLPSGRAKMEIVPSICKNTVFYFADSFLKRLVLKFLL